MGKLSRILLALAGGCFWGVEAMFEHLEGVIDVVSGYSGGEADTAHYEIVGTGSTGHAESVLITYDAVRISYGTLLKVFFSVAHDPTQLNYQGPDVGTQYRSAPPERPPWVWKAREALLRSPRAGAAVSPSSYSSVSRLAHSSFTSTFC